MLLAFNAVNNLFGTGCSSMMSRALGRKDTETAQRCASFGFWCSLLCGLLFSVLATAFQRPLLSGLSASAENRDAAAAYLHWTVSLGAAPAILNVVLAYFVRAEGSSVHASVGTMCGLRPQHPHRPGFHPAVGPQYGRGRVRAAPRSCRTASPVSIS